MSKEEIQKYGSTEEELKAEAEDVKTELEEKKNELKEIEKNIYTDSVANLTEKEMQDLTKIVENGYLELMVTIMLVSHQHLSPTHFSTLTLDRSLKFGPEFKTV